MTGMRKFFGLLLLLSMIPLLACGLTVSDGEGDKAAATVVNSSSSVNGAAAETETIISEVVRIETDLESRLAELYEQLNPSVVSIQVYVAPDHLFPLGSGSGFVFDLAGHIVTNNHVVESGEVFEVVFADGNRSYAEVVGTDVDSDLAVIRVENLPDSAHPITLGNSRDLQVGQLVVAIGNPFLQQGSMSMGIVSGLGRSLNSQRELEFSSGRFSLPEVIQTDAPINPGNSGGPLINLSGLVLGVNSAIVSETGVNSGVGFTIPSAAVKKIVPALIADGEYVYSYLGVQIQSLNLILAEFLGVAQVDGAYVSEITAGGPASRSDLVAGDQSEGNRGGDLIVAVNGNRVRNTEELIAYQVYETEPGDTIELTVLRGEKEVNVEVTLGARP